MFSSYEIRDMTALATAVGVYKPERKPRSRIDWLDYKRKRTPRRVGPRPEGSGAADIVLGVVFGSLLWAPPLLWMAEVI